MKDMKEHLNTLLQTSMKAGDKTTVNTVRSIIASATTFEKANPGKPVDYTQLLQTAKKQRMQAIEEYKKGGREDLVASEQLEMFLIESLLPKQMDDADATFNIMAIVTETGINNMGLMMKEFQKRFPGQVDGKRLSDLVKRTLTPNTTI